MWIELTDEETSLLAFILDSTLEEYEDTHMTSVLSVAEDPSIRIRADLSRLKRFYKDLSELLESAGSLNDMNTVVKQIREKLASNGLVHASNGPTEGI